MKKITIYLVVGLISLFLSQDSYAAAKQIKCGDPNGVTVTVTLTGASVPASDSAGAMAQYSQRLANQAEAQGKIKCKIEECQKDKLPGSCRPRFLGFDGTPPTPTKVNDSTYSFPPVTNIKIKVSCSECRYPKVAIAMISDPLYGTYAMCDGAPNQVVIDMPGTAIFDVNGLPMTPVEAQERWLDIIVHDNGNNIEGSVPWGCMLSECAQMGYGGCDMDIWEHMSQPVPMPQPDPETGGWVFEPTSYEMIYSCSACEPPGGPHSKKKSQTLGVERNSEGEIGGLIENLYPNPANDKINLMLSFQEGNAQITVLDLSGKVVKSFNVASSASSKALISFDVNDLPAGIYQLNVATENETSARKFSVNK